MYRVLAIKEDCGCVSVFLSHFVYFFRLVINVVIFRNMNRHGPLGGCPLKSFNAEIVKKKMKTGH